MSSTKKNTRPRSKSSRKHKPPSPNILSLENPTIVTLTDVSDKVQGTVIVPDTVTAIDANAFYIKQYITDIKLHNVTSIGIQSFAGCYNLQRLDMPKVTSIDDEAFMRCQSLEQIDLPKATNNGPYSFNSFANLI